ncbi:TPA: hypothetical protein DEF17_01115 [bacterium]|nr:MAG: hypothetical protein AUJ18_07955 [Candidatus Hydrogenedentes bacterium CG1_02_42_14]PIU47005.1 MAG: hypothetical protein COS94_08590 [Candidatus Hydrogenedentes bacterium CG07_land_8_20_14_0_80_42_17]HBW46516.1 hypothetical protein [bacterium]
MWIDEIELSVRSGDGGDGVVSFRHEKCVEFGGPNGGNGGKGGDVIFVASRHLTSLFSLRGKKRLKAENGEHGGTSLCTGKSGKELVIKVPIGTVIRRAGDGAVIADFVNDGEKCLALEGGRGGRGNAAFVTSVRRSPKERELGEKGKTLSLKFELRLIADVGLIGLPNAGKSTLLSRLSAARPKIADYPFTTLEPSLGIVDCGGSSFTLADMPGLIRGAHTGKGLGIKFLRHIERTRLLLHLVDSTSENPLEDYRTIQEELELYGHGLFAKKSILVFTKIDAADPPNIEGVNSIAISSQSGKGLEKIKRIVLNELDSIPAVEPLRSEITSEVKMELPVTVRKDGDVFLVEGDAVRRYLDRRKPEDFDGWRRFWNALVRWGVADELRRIGIEEGDTVVIGDIELEYWDEDK